ncbi:MAG: hypothetical protein WBE26_19380, partial [Phycisphaerae bacterium]
LEDVASLQRCFGGSFGEPGYVTPSTECLRHHDFDPEDDDVDLPDFEEFQAVMDGPPVSAE